MIGSITSASFTSFDSYRSSSGGQFDAARHSQSEDHGSKSLSGKKAKDDQEKFSNPNELDEDEKRQVEELKQRDAEVRAHEQAHMAAAGSLAMGGPNYVFQTGPDGKQYAIGGNVKIDTSPGRTPEETARKAQQIRAAALAPNDPSPQDIKVAASASAMEQEAATKQDKKSDTTSGKTGFSQQTPNGEITSSRQVAASSQSESDGQQSDSGDSPSGSNPYMMEVAKLYKDQQRSAY